MREQDRFDWNEEDFESLADETQSPEDLDFESMGDENSMISDEVMDQELSDESSEGSQEIDDSGLVDIDSGNGIAYPRESNSNISSWSIGFLFGFSTLVASLGLGGAMLFALSGNPLSLWDPSGLVQVDQWFNFQGHPLNILYIVGFSIMLLAVMGSWAVARAVTKAKGNLVASEELLSRICNLRLDNENDWQSPAFNKDVAASSFVNETLGAWRLHQTRQKKYLGLEGELIRLQKAIQGNQRSEISGPYENHLAGLLADEVARLFDERECALQETCVVQEKDQHESESIIGIIQDARSWNRHTLDQVGVQGATLDRVSSRLDQMKSYVDTLEQGTASGKNESALQDIRHKLAEWKQSTQAGDQGGELNNVLDRANKLAFQIAMEVARLGSKGERLLPMTQSLDDVNTELRKISGNMANSSVAERDPGWLQLQTLIGELSASLRSGGGKEIVNLKATVGELSPVTASIGQQLADIARSFNQQGDRLTKLGEACSELTGVSFDSDYKAAGKADNPPEGSLNLSQFDPFGSEETEVEPITTEVDPFSADDISLPDNSGFEKSEDFTSSVIPGEDIPLISQEPEQALSSEEEIVYDLSEFGAVRIEQDSAQVDDDPDDQIYDLSEFGAVTMS